MGKPSKGCPMWGVGFDAPLPTFARKALPITLSVELRGPARPAYAGVKSFAKAKR